MGDGHLYAISSSFPNFRGDEQLRLRVWKQPIIWSLGAVVPACIDEAQGDPAKRGPSSEGVAAPARGVQAWLGTVTQKWSK